MITKSPYKRLAERLDALPSGFPPTPDGAELRLLEKLFRPEEAALASKLRITLETPEEIAGRLAEAGWEGLEPLALAPLLKSMARKGLICAARTENGLSFGLMPFVVGIYESQSSRIDAELAALFENYYRQSFGQMLAVQPAFHRIIPVGESIRVDMEIQPFESACEMIENNRSWGVIDCICRVQKALVGEACHHPVDVCMILSEKPNAFDHQPVIRALTQEGALATLKRAADAGLVHSVSNVRKEISYICNCCTCSCGILRGLSELGIANGVARSAFVNQVEATYCIGCELCVELCQFRALVMGESYVQVSRTRCVGCGVCVSSCPEGALGLVRRPPEEILPVPDSEWDWRAERAKSRGIDLYQVL